MGVFSPSRGFLSALRHCLMRARHALQCEAASWQRWQQNELWVNRVQRGGEVPHWHVGRWPQCKNVGHHTQNLSFGACCQAKHIKAICSGSWVSCVLTGSHRFCSTSENNYWFYVYQKNPSQKGEMPLGTSPIDPDVTTASIFSPFPHFLPSFFFFLKKVIETFDPVHFGELGNILPDVRKENKQPFRIFLYFLYTQCFSSYSEVMRVHRLLSNHLLDFIAGFQSPALYTHPWTRFSLIINQWSIKQAICPIRAGGPSRPCMAYLAVWLERSAGNGYACIIDQNQVFKHLSHVSRSVRPFRFPSRTSHRLWKTRVQ